MDGIKHSRQFAEMERLVSDYFHCHLAPVMSKTQAYLTKKQGEEMREYSTSLGGILSAMASAAQPMGDPYQVLKVTGEWNSKTTEDYIGMCKAEITGSKGVVSIFSRIPCITNDALCVYMSSFNKDITSHEKSAIKSIIIRLYLCYCCFCICSIW